MLARSSRRWTIATLVAVCSLVVLSFVPPLSLAQPDSSLPGHTQVIAQGVDLMPTVPVAWRLTSSTAQPANNGEFVDRTLGFAVGGETPFLISHGDSDTHTLLRRGQASFHVEGASERRSSIGDQAAGYVNLELIVADAVDTQASLGSSTLDYASEPFTAPAGNRDLRLFRDVLASGEEGSFPGTGDVPYLFAVSDGTVQVTNADGQSFQLNAGDASEFTGGIQLLPAASTGGVWVAATIGDEVQLPPASEPAATGATVQLQIVDCDSLEQALEDCTPSSDPALIVLVPEIASAGESPDSEIDGNTLVYSNLSAEGPWKIVSEPLNENGAFMSSLESDDMSSGSGSQPDDFEWVISLEPGQVWEGTFIRVPNETAGDEGELMISIFTCPDGTIETGCEPADNASDLVPDFGVWQTGGGLTVDDAQVSGDGANFLYRGLPVATFAFSAQQAGAPPDVVVEGATLDEDAGYYMFDVEAGQRTQVTIYFISGLTDATGSLMVALYDCPQGSDPAVDSGECTGADDSWSVDVGLYRGQRWTLENDADYSGNAHYVFADLPAADLTISWDSDGGEVVHTEGIEQSGLVGPYVTIPADGQHEIVLYRIRGEVAPEQSGTLLLSLYDCPADADPWATGDVASCTPTTAPWDITVDQLSENGSGSWSMFVDAESLGNGQYRFIDLPAETLVTQIDEDGPPGDIMVYATGDVYSVPDVYVADIPAGGEATASLYRVNPGDQPPPVDPDAETGTLVVNQSDCDYGTDPAVDTSTCANSTDPWAVTVTNDATGESWSLLAIGVAYDSGTYALESLPAGSYSIFVSSNENWTLSYPTSIDVSADDETYVTVYSVDLREP